MLWFTLDIRVKWLLSNPQNLSEEEVSVRHLDPCGSFMALCAVGVKKKKNSEPTLLSQWFSYLTANNGS